MPIPLASPSSSALPTNLSVGVVPVSTWFKLPRRAIFFVAWCCCRGSKAFRSGFSAPAGHAIKSSSCVLRISMLFSLSSFCDDNASRRLASALSLANCSSRSITRDSSFAFWSFWSFSSCTKHKACAKGSRKSGVRQNSWNDDENVCR